MSKPIDDIRNRQIIIDDIIKQRVPFKQQIEEKQAILRKRRFAIQALQDMYNEIMRSGEAILIDRLKDLRLSRLLDRIDDEIMALDKPLARFSRLTLNIGVIGRARQGKSSLLKSLSGLSSDVIPTGGIGHCTGTRSLICHDPDQETHGEITFYSESEFLQNVLAPYYETLSLPGGTPKSIAQFATDPLPTLPSNSSNQKGPAKANERYRHLAEDYKANVQDYRQQLNMAPLRVTPDKIREFVAQDSADGARIYFNYLAVKEAKIVCAFDHKDVGQIALVDMPGLGDTGIGAEERLIKALEEHIDIVLFVHMPSFASGILTDVDYDLYDLAYGALNDLPIDLWSFMVLNHTKLSSLTDNYNTCEAVKKLIMTSDVKSSLRSFNVVDCIIADCSNAEEAKSEVLDTVLNHLVQHMRDLDKRYMSVWQRRLLELEAEIESELQQAARLDTSAPEFDQERQFDKLFNPLWKVLVNHLKAFLDVLDERRLSNNFILKNYFQETFALCKADSCLPSLESIETERNLLNGYIGAFEQFLREMRTHLTHHFANIDEHLNLSMEEVKSELAQIFSQVGLLGTLVQHNTGTAFFKQIEELLMHSGVKRQEEIFRVFAYYELSLQGFFRSRIRTNLKNMEPDLTHFRINPDDEAEGVRKKLEDAHSSTVALLEEAINAWLHEPGNAAWAMVSEFIDQILYSRSVQEDRTAREEWRSFYYGKRLVIWSDIFGNIDHRQRLIEQWQFCVNNAISINHAESLLFVI
jgi:hypothetical protein